MSTTTFDSADPARFEAADVAPIATKFGDSLTQTQYYRVLRSLLDEGTIAPGDRVLCVFGGRFDRAVLGALGIDNFELSNIDEGEDCAVVDACSMPYADESFDHVVAHAGLHHASRPHQALCEMMRVAKKTAVFCESQDSALMRLLVKLRVVPAYEWNAIIENGYQRGGVDDKPVPNYVYRWTPREVEKTVRSFYPERAIDIEFHREWAVTWPRIARRLQSTPIGKLPQSVIEPSTKLAVSAFNRLLGHQGNGFAAVIRKDRMAPQPWIEGSLEQPCLKRDLPLWRIGVPSE